MKPGRSQRFYRSSRRRKTDEPRLGVCGPGVPTYLTRPLSVALVSYKEETYFLGGGGEIGGVNTSKFRLTRGTKTYIIYVDRDYVVKRVEDYQPKASSGTSSRPSGTNKTSGKEKKSSEYPASDYAHPDDFYYDYYDDFYDYEDAEDYWEEYG